MRRREFITLVGGVAALPFAARAQQADRMRRIGALMAFAEDDREAMSLFDAFRRELRDLGWIEGKNVHIDVRWAGNDFSRMYSLAGELLSMEPDAIFATTSPSLTALRQRTRTIPIVFALIADAVDSGFVNSMAHPGGNITGFNSYEFSIGGKWLELLRQIAPGVREVAVILEPGNASNAGNLQSIENAVLGTGVKLTSVGVHNGDEIERAIDGYAKAPNRGFIVLGNPTTNGNRQRIAAAMSGSRLPAVYPFEFFVSSGGLASYGPDLPNVFRQAASYVNRILTGEKAADLPVQFPTKFKLVINLKTAKAMGLTIPSTLLTRADEVIE